MQFNVCQKGAFILVLALLFFVYFPFNSMSHKRTSVIIYQNYTALIIPIDYDSTINDSNFMNVILLFTEA